MIRGHNELKTYVIKNWNYIAKAQEPSSLTEPENKKNPTWENKQKEDTNQLKGYTEKKTYTNLVPKDWWKHMSLKIETT